MQYNPLPRPCQIHVNIHYLFQSWGWILGEQSNSQRARRRLGLGEVGIVWSLIPTFQAFKGSFLFYLLLPYGVFVVTRRETSFQLYQEQLRGTKERKCKYFPSKRLYSSHENG